MDSCHEAILCFVRDLDGRMPPSTPVKEVHDTSLVHKQNVTFNLLIECVRDGDGCDAVWQGLHPLSADSASVNDVWHQIKDFAGQACSTKNGSH